MLRTDSNHISTVKTWECGKFPGFNLDMNSILMWHWSGCKMIVYRPKRDCRPKNAPKCSLKTVILYLQSENVYFPPFDDKWMSFFNRIIKWPHLKSTTSDMTHALCTTKNTTWNILRLTEILIILLSLESDSVNLTVSRVKYSFIWNVLWPFD